MMRPQRCNLYLMSCFAPNMNQAVLNLISKLSTECISLHQAMKQSTRMNMNSKIRNALLIIMNDRSFELSEHMYECMSIVHGNMTFYHLSIYSYTVVVYQFVHIQWHSHC